MQEPSASSAVTVLNVQKGEFVLDLCAAPGGKSTQIAAALDGTGLLWCNEYVKGRAAVLCQNIERLGVTNAVVSNADTTPLCDQLDGCFDAVLADVPCSGEGMFRKEPVALSQWSEELVHECAARGAMILENAAKAVRAGGRIVYSTCTFAPEENELQIAAFLQAHPDFELVDIDVSFGRAGFDAAVLAPFGEADASLPLSRTRRIFPADGGEGHFIALLRKKGDDTRREQPMKIAKDPTFKDAEQLLADCFLTPPSGVLARFGDTVRLLPEGMPQTRGIPILWAGVPIGTVAKNRLEPHHGLFAACSLDNCKRAVDLSLDDPRALAFLHGEEITVDADKGFCAVAVEGVPCGFGKVSSTTLKNRYPKGLRLMY